MKKNILKINKGLIYTLLIVFSLNILVLGTYTVITNLKISAALNLIKPQTASLVMISEKSCENCKNMEALEEYIAGQNVEITDRKELSADQDESKDLIEKYEIKRLPALIFTADAKINNSLQKAYEPNSRSISDKVIVWEQWVPPFYDLKGKETQGIINVVYLSDKSCGDCYDPAEIFAGIYKNFGINVNGQQTFDVSDPEGLEFIANYKVKNVPTVILSENVALYEQFASIWPDVGTIEEDGKYIFRNIDSMQQIYKNLETGEITKPNENNI